MHANKNLLFFALEMNKNTPTQYLQSGEKCTVPLVLSSPFSWALFGAVRSCCRSTVWFGQPVPPADSSVTHACLRAGKGGSLKTGEDMHVGGEKVKKYAVLY